MGWWNSLSDTAQRLFVPLGGTTDSEKAPWWDLGGRMRAEGPGAEEVRRRKMMQDEQAGKAGGFADQGEAGYNALGGESSAERDYLRRLASGQDSVSAEQLRQGLQQNLAAQRSLAAGASPQNSGMAARTAAMQSARIGSGMAGAQAVAGLQERQMAHRQLSDMIMEQRRQELQRAQGSRGQAIAGYGTPQEKEKSELEKYGPALGAIAGLFSDKRLKKNIRRAGREADEAIKGLRAYTYAYKDEAHGKGKQTGVMAQDLEKAGLKHAVFDTPIGKAVHAGKLAGANTALIARLGERVAKLEGRGK